MNKLGGVDLLVAAALSLIIFFTAPSRARLASQADSGGISALASRPDTIFLYAGGALGRRAPRG